MEVKLEDQIVKHLDDHGVTVTVRDGLIALTLEEAIHLIGILEGEEV